MKKGFRKGIVLCLPICVGVAAYGGVFGVLAAAKGIPVWLVALMSAFVFSGSAQFVIADMWGEAGFWAILGSVASINMRYLLICASVDRLLSGMSLPQRMLRVHLIGDENWAVAMAARTDDAGKADILFAGGLCFLPVWLAASLAGRLAGGWIPSPERFGLDFAFPALFAALVVSLWRGREDIAPWIVTACVTVVVDSFSGGGWGVLAGGLAGAGFRGLSEGMRT